MKSAENCTSKLNEKFLSSKKSSAVETLSLIHIFCYITIYIYLFIDIAYKILLGVKAQDSMLEITVCISKDCRFEHCILVDKRQVQIVRFQYF